MTLVKVNNPLSRTFDGFVNDFFNDLPGRQLHNGHFGFPPVNITEKENAYNLEVAAPGWQKENFNVKLDGNLLTISAEKKEETKDETAKVIRKEFKSKSFKRSFTVDENINAENISAKYENGVLQVELPKKEVVKPSAKEISIQ
ncbi:Hsp20/alpha crystallin family protein [Ferruginibacter albus]|uniref:Hsp20/alpha crystallin family protein n=1 Tax=Ferruginibacter albus TaxID=2875540 RepID=UPI001CC7EEE7|nr:Hsp20/alpha crystallin family protein [Ferruginibacter albus]UAY51167.1 Hsp20/alpha crystallin family protein [Ferruginibacter albus]